VLLANFILGLHFAIITFNVLGLVVIPVGGALGWHVVRVAWLRLLHLGLMAAVAGQALMGRACILTIWQNELTGNRSAPVPMIMQWVNHLIYWNLPIWVFAVMYSAVFLYVVALVVWVPFMPMRAAGTAMTPRWRRRRRGGR
jgi:hypothetical protein